MHATERCLNSKIYTTSLTKTRTVCPVSRFGGLFRGACGVKVPFAVRTKRYKDTRGVVSSIRTKTEEVNRKVTVEKRDSLVGRLTRGKVKVRVYPVDGLRAGTMTKARRCPVERFLGNNLGMAIGASGHAIDSAAVAGRLRFVRGACKVQSSRVLYLVGGTTSMTFTASSMGSGLCQVVKRTCNTWMFAQGIADFRIRGAGGEDIRVICGGLIAYLRDMEGGVSFGPRMTLVLKSKLKSFTSKVGVRRAVSCARVRKFPISAMGKRGKHFMFNCMRSAPIIVVRKHIRCCRKCGVSSIILPAHLVKVLKTGGVLLAGTTNKYGPSCGTKSFVVVASRVAAKIPDPLVKPGVRRLKAEFPSVDRICDGHLRSIVHGYTTRYNIRVRRNICIRFAKPGCRAPTRVELTRD